MVSCFIRHKGLFVLSMGIMLSACNLHAEFSIKKVIGDTLCLPFARSKASDHATAKVNAIMQELDPSQSVTEVRQMNRFAQYLFGYQNAIALPFLNYVLVNEKWLDKLPDDAQKFLIGRSLMHLSKAEEYSLKKYVLPFLLNAAFKYGIPLASLLKEAEEIKEIQESFTKKWENRNISGLSDHEQEQYIKEANVVVQKSVTLGTKAFMLMLLGIASELFVKKVSRSVELDADYEVARKLNCASAGVEVLEDSLKYKNDKSLLGKISSFYNIAQLLPFAKTIKRYTPGQFTNAPDRVTHFFLNLPILHYFSSYPRTKTRIQALKELARKAKKAKEVKPDATDSQLEQAA